VKTTARPELEAATALNRSGMATHAAAWRRAPWTVAAVVLLAYLLWVGAYVAAGHSAQDFIVIGKAAVLRSNASPLIQYDPRYYYTDRLGYDGQYSYFIAVDPVRARFYMDWPAYRYTRIAYPLLARALALGQAELIPDTLILINLLAMAGGTLALAAWLRRRGRSPWLALIYGLSLGLFIAVNGDLTEPMAYALVALAVYLLDFGGRRRVLWAALCFGVAVLTRETTAIFAVVYGCALALQEIRAPAGGVPATRDAVWARLREVVGAARRNWRPAALLLGVALAPYALYKLFLWVWLGSLGVPPAMRPEVVPFAGMLAHWPLQGLQIVVVDCVILPALICAGMGLWALTRGSRSVAVWALLANVLFLVVLLPADSYIDHFAAARISTGVVLAALYAVPAFDELTGTKRLWLLACALLWMMFLPLQIIGLLHATPAGYH